jgi:16S rRNA (guanine(527)-N(7))-methyltransferase RsmG
MQLPAGIVSLDDDQRARLGQYADELAAMNQRINLVSREDAGAIASRHIPHCLTLAIRVFPDGATVVDWGTGGGLPLIPLAIAFPRVRFIGVDAVGKKIQAVRTFARRLGLANVEAWHGRAEEFDEEIDFSVSRATAPLAVLWSWHEPLARHGREVAGVTGRRGWCVLREVISATSTRNCPARCRSSECRSRRYCRMIILPLRKSSA